MSRKLHLERYFLCFIAHNTNYAQVQNVLKNVDKQQYKVLCEIAVNILESVIDIDSTSLEKLKPHKLIIRKLADRRLSKASLAREASVIAELVRLTLQYHEVC